MHPVLYGINFQLTPLKIIERVFIYLAKHTLLALLTGLWKTAKEQTKSYCERAIESTLEYFYMDDFLD